MNKECTSCGHRLQWTTQGHTVSSSDNLDDCPICFECMADHCVATECEKCSYKTPDCQFLDIKRYYLEHEDV